MFDPYISGEIIRELRLKRGKTQEKVAEEVGMNIKTYRAIEKGTRRGRIESLCILASYFDVSLDFLVLGNEYLENYIVRRIENEDKAKKVKILLIVEAIMDII